MQIRIASLNDVKSIVDFQLKMAAETEGIELHESTVLKGFTAVIMGLVPIIMSLSGGLNK